MFDGRKNTIFLDCDGVLADFDKAATALLGMYPALFEETYGSESFWATIKSDPDFFINLELLSDAMELYNAVHQFKHAILTGIPKGMDDMHNQKVSWGAEYFPGVEVFCCQSSKKWTFCQHGDVLIDDRYRYAKNWTKAGGTFIHHKSAEQTIKELENMGII